jgi:hypothetical protein
MPKIEIDYSNTIIYKITCKDSSVTDVYVGHTTNFVQRKHSHKQSCINDKTPNHNCKLYDVIRNNGGWNNWKMEIINFFNCQDHYEARKKEQEYFVSLNATLNSIEPMPKPKIKPIEEKQFLYCEKCNLNFSNSNLLEFHNNTEKHKKFSVINIDNNIVPKNPIEFYCEKCHYLTSNKKDYNKHINTNKHKSTHSQIHEHKKLPLMECLCGKKYKDYSGLWRHKKKCNLINNQNNVNDYKNEQEKKDDLINYLIKENQEFKKLILEFVKKDYIQDNDANNTKILKKIAKEVTIDKS